jgi:hypothetical protein
MIKKIVLILALVGSYAHAASAPPCAGIEENLKACGAHLYDAGSHGAQVVGHILQAIPPLLTATVNLGGEVCGFVKAYPAITLILGAAAGYGYHRFFIKDDKRQNNHRTRY